MGSLPLQDRKQGIKLPVSSPVTFFQLLRGQVPGLVDDLEATVIVPIIIKDAAFPQQLLPDLGARARGQNKHKRDRGLDDGRENLR